MKNVNLTDIKLSCYY